MNKLIFTAILPGFAGLYAMSQNEIRLMDMDLNKSYQTYGGAVKGKSVTNEPVSIQGKTYDDVIGVQAKSHIKIDLHKNASRFQAQVGIADSHIDYTDKSLTVIPFVDGTKMYFDTRKNAKNLQIAEALGVSIKTVEYRITQSLKILRVKLKDYLPFIMFLF